MLFPMKIRHWELYTAPPSGIISKTFSQLANKNFIVSETVYDWRKLSGRPTKYRLRELLKTPLSGGKKMTSFIFCKKIPLSQKCSVDEVKVMIWLTQFGIRNIFKLTYGHFASWTYRSWSWKSKLYALLAIMLPMWVETHVYWRHSAWPIILPRAWTFILGSLCKLSSFFLNTAIINFKKLNGL